MSDGQYFRQGHASALNLSAAAVVSVVPPDFSRGQARLVRINVVVAGSAAGGAYDANTTAGNIAANLIASIPNVVGSYLIDFPIMAGILIVPGTGQTVAVSYD
ncbi:MAG: hypothetical protein KGL17_03990 [Betaproteobacteria bacterium]|nr:hypothetical protein [Betaproteobacteria bacterium]